MYRLTPYTLQLFLKVAKHCIFTEQPKVGLLLLLWMWSLLYSCLMIQVWQNLFFFSILIGLLFIYFQFSFLTFNNCLVVDNYVQRPGFTHLFTSL